MFQLRLGRIFLIMGFLIIAALFSLETFALEMNIIEVKRNIPLSDEAPVYKDFYINAGTNAGLKKNLVVNVLRKVPIRDATGTQTFGDMNASVGQLKIIAVSDRVAVAREYELSSRSEEPMLEQAGIMIGDQLVLDGSFIDKRKSSAK